MKKTYSTKRPLIMALLALVLCLSMLVGTTFAWFTDSASSSNNRIVSGNLAVDLLMYQKASDSYVSIKDGEGDIFSAATGNGILWEPGKTEIVYLAVKNDGSLDLKYNILLNITDGGLIGSLEYAVLANTKNTDMTATSWADLRAVAETGNVAAGTTLAAPNGKLEAGATEYFALAVHMKEEAGNEYQGKDVVIDVIVQAGQLASESDSFGTDYDKLAILANGAFQMKSLEGTAPKQDETGKFQWTNEDNTFSVSGLTDDSVNISAEPASTDADLVATAGDDKTIISYDIKVDGQKDGSTVYVDMYIGTGLTNVVLYHEGTAMPTENYSYDSLTGILSFETTSFSVYSAAFSTIGTLPLASVKMMSAQELAEVNPEEVIVATLFPSFGLSDNEAKPLETGYVFTANQTGEEAAASEYANWHADFAVSFDGNVPTGSAALAGQYDAFSDNWFAFEAFDVDDSDGIDGIPANQTFRLLEAFAQINYTELCESIKVFKCGAYTLNDQVDGVTMTVELRLYETYTEEECMELFGYSSVNEETGAYKTVGVYHYTF